MTAGNRQTPCMGDVDLLLHSTWLLACELRHGAVPVDGEQLHRHCQEQIETVRAALLRDGAAQGWADQVCLVQCAVLDEAVMACTGDAIRDRWQAKPLQAQYLGHHRAGELLYERMDQALRDPATDRALITLFHRALLLGFEGRYRQGSLPREQRLQALHERAFALEPAFDLGPEPPRNGWARRGLLRHPLLHLACAALLVACVWWLADASLEARLQALFPGVAP